MIIVNLMVAAEGNLKLPAVHSMTDLKIALSALASVPARDVMAVEVFWSPQVNFCQHEALLVFVLSVKFILVCLVHSKTCLAFTHEYSCTQADDDVMTQQDCMVKYPALVPL